MKSFLSFSRVALVGLIYCIPFLAYYVSSSLFFPYITGKNFAFRTIVELMMFFWIPLATLSSSWRPKIKSIILAFYAFATVLFCAAIFGMNPLNSLFSNFERMEGFVTIFYLLFFTLITAVTLKGKEWDTYFYVSLVANALVVFDATAAAFKSPAQRLDGTLGNAGYLSIYAVWGMFMIAFLWVRHQYKNVFATSFLSLLFVLNFFVLWKTQTRGTLLGLGVGLGGMFLFYLYEFLKKKIGKMKASIFLSLTAFSFFILTLFGLPLIKNSDFVKASPTLTRLASISLGEQTVRSRFMIWGMSYAGVTERPLLGFGQDNFGYVFAKHYNPEMFDQEQWFDRSHNVFFDWSIAGGILGLLSYLSLFGALVYAIFKTSTQIFTKNEKVLLLAFLAVYFIHNIFIFDNLISYIAFFSLFAFVLHKTKHQEKNITPEKFSESAFWLSLVVSGIIFCVSFYHIVYKPLEKNTAIAAMLGGASTDIIQTTQRVLKDDTLYGTAEGREQAFSLGIKVQQETKVSDDIKNAFVSMIGEAGEAQVVKDPLNPRPALLLSGYYLRVGDKEKGVSYFEKGLALTPTKTLLYGEATKMYDSLGDNAKALSAAEKGFALTARSLDNAVLLALLYEKNKEYEKSFTTMEKAIGANKNSPESYVAFVQVLKKIKSPNLEKVSASFLALYPEYTEELNAFLKTK